ncbi:MAG TPA: alpha-galactosidase [Spirochaetia bacterium]|nr:alpha-galactosidase [Spirochaetia bacterium]
MNTAQRTKIKIAYVGGGSRGWAPNLMSDLALSPFLEGEIALYDIDQEAAKANVSVGQAIFSHPQAKTKLSVSAVGTLTQALDGADFVVISIEPGPTTLRYADLEIPKRYGILQTVGDTTGPGGILRALRTVSIYEELAREIMLRCPKAWVINYTNPMTICTASLYAVEPNIKAFGCCHEVFSAQEALAKLVGRWFDVEEPNRSEIVLDIAGVNHFTFATAASWKGEALLPRMKSLIDESDYFADRTTKALERRLAEEWFDHDSLIASDFLRRFGALGAAGDRHLAEFVPWYLVSEDNLHRWGVVATPYEWRVRRMSEYSRRDADAPLTPSGEEGVGQIHALLGITDLVTNVNMPNRGQMVALPSGSVVESYARFSQNEVRPIVCSPLPSALEGIVRRISQVQEMTLKAARERNVDLAFQAVLSDPLVHIPTDQAWRMFREMLDHVKGALPGWRL